MDLQCPGRMSGARDSKLVPCAACGRQVEIFSDEPKTLCRCGAPVFSEALPACFQWCPAADRCLGAISGGGVPAVTARPGLKPQENYQQALDKALAGVRAQPREALVELGCRPAGPNQFELPVLDGVFRFDLESGRVTVTGPGAGDGETAREPRIGWRILALHYLAARAPRSAGAKWVSFADLADARGYDPVYHARVIARLCATAGRDRATFAEACRRLLAARMDCGDEGHVFQVFPRLALAIAWYAGDEEIRPGVSFLYPDNIGAFLPVEDVVVISERLVGRLQGGGW